MHFPLQAWLMLSLWSLVCCAAPFGHGRGHHGHRHHGQHQEDRPQRYPGHHMDTRGNTRVPPGWEPNMEEHYPFRMWLSD